MGIANIGETAGIKTISENAEMGVFEIDGLFAGYGLTIGNALRRVLFSSLSGAGVTEIKVKNASHEFSTLPGMKEDMVELILNFKKLRFRAHTEEPHVLKLQVKGERTVQASDIEADAEVEVMNPDEVIAHLTDKNAELDIELKVESGLGYSPVESRKNQGRFPIGAIAVDAVFTPVLHASYVVENMRVGERTDYNRIRMEIKTDGSMSPSAALQKAAGILRDHFEKVTAVSVQSFEERQHQCMHLCISTEKIFQILNILFACWAGING